jgi:hypothetical protein
VEVIKNGREYSVEEDELVDCELDQMADDERTFESIRKLGDTINPMIQLTVDYPSNHRNGKVPILDLEVWIVRKEDGHQKVLYSFYEKAMKSKFVLMNSSAVPTMTKRGALTNEAIRRLRNCHEDIPEEDLAKVLSDYSQKLKNSGYGAKYRREIIDGGLKAYKKQREDDSLGIKPMYREREWEKMKRKKEKKKNKFGWWKKTQSKRGRPKTIMKIPYTHNSGLKKVLDGISRSQNYHVKFVETSGYSLQNLLGKSNPFSTGKCGRADCFPCQQERGGKCEDRGAAYKITCEDPACNGKDVQYGGESGKNGYSRGVEHLQEYKRKDEDNPLYKHAHNDHNKKLDIKYKMTVLKTFGKDNMARKVDEGLRIARHKGIKLNSKSEFRQPKIPRIRIISDVNE